MQIDCLDIDLQDLPSFCPPHGDRPGAHVSEKTLRAVGRMDGGQRQQMSERRWRQPTSGAPETDDIVTRSPLSMVRTGTSLASKKPQCTVAGPASTRGTLSNSCNENSGLELRCLRCTAYRNFVKVLGRR